MCGIFAIHDSTGRFLTDEKLSAAEAAMAHRGPDGRGRFRSGPVALLHRRLVLIDPEGGQQPMTDASGRWTLVFNGTIFNHAELRTEFRDYCFRTRSDTEVLLALLSTRGVAGLEAVRGEFAIVLHDAARDELIAVRDRFGTKPLYLARHDAAIGVASCIRSLLAVGLAAPAPDLETIDEYLSFMTYLPGRTFFRDVTLLPPGHLARISSGGITISRYDQPRFIVGAPSDEEIRAAFVKAVERSLVADVPVGTYLSGGIDSTSIAAAAARRRPGLQGFTVGFSTEDERPVARASAAAIGLLLRESEITDAILPRRLPALVREIESPRMGHIELNDAAAGLARREVVSVLSGCGGDEIFGGYTPHYVPGEDQATIQAARFRIVLQPEAKSDLYQRNLLEAAAIDVAARTDKAGRVIHDYAAEAIASAGAIAPLHRAMAFHAACYLPGLLLVDDAIAMSRGLDVRTPFLDRDLVDLAWRLAPTELFDGVIGKKALRRALAPILPAAVAGDPVKRGFGAPGGWMRGAATAVWIKSLFAAEPASARFIQPEAARTIVDDYLEGRNQRSRRVWTLLNLELWSRIFLDGARPEDLAAGMDTA
jgi:asparagine synthase (glutamine-hydrolysing)